MGRGERSDTSLAPIENGGVTRKFSVFQDFEDRFAEKRRMIEIYKKQNQQDEAMAMTKHPKVMKWLRTPRERSAFFRVWISVPEDKSAVICSYENMQLGCE